MSRLRIVERKGDQLLRNAKSRFWALWILLLGNNINSLHFSHTLDPRPPFTLQRLCELLVEPQQYTSTKKYLNALEKVRRHPVK